MFGLRIPLSVDSAGYRRGLESAKKETERFTGSIKGMLIGAFGGAAIAAGMRSVAQEVSKLEDQAKKVNASFAEMQRIAGTAARAGVSLNEITAILVRIQRRAGDAARGSSELRTAFQNLGIDYQSFASMRPERQMIALADAFKEGQRSGTNVADTMKVLDTEARSLFPMFEMGGKALAEAFASVDSSAGHSVAAIKRVEAAMIRLREVGVTLMDNLVQAGTGVADVFATLGQIMTKGGSFQEIFAERRNRRDDALFRGNRSGISDEAIKDLSKAEKSDDSEVKALEERFKREQKAREEMAAALASLSEAEIEASMRAMSVDEKRVALQQLIAHHKRQANKETVEGIEHSLKMIELQRELADIEAVIAKEIEEAVKEKKKEKEIEQAMPTPSISVSDLQAIGGGGGAFGGNFDAFLAETQRQTALLERIADNTAASPTSPDGSGFVF